MHYNKKCAYRTLLASQSWPGFEYYSNDILCHRLSGILVELEERIPRLDVTLLAALMRDGGLSQSLENLRALRIASSAIDGQVLPLPAHSPVLYNIAVGAVRDAMCPPVKVREVRQLDELLQDAGEPSEVLGWFSEGSGPVREWLDDISWQIGAAFRQSLDLPGVNSLVREGLVRQTLLPGGSHVVIKRDNPAKAGRLANELRNVARIVSRLGLADHKSVRVLSDSSSVSLAVVRPLSVIRTSNDGVCYSVMPLVPHPTLEAVLLAQTDAGERDTLLRKTRKLLDFLYANGIVWGDMAPRNILVEQTPTATVFHVLDFEKTDLLDGPVPDGHREAHARGPIFVEEFGAICSQDEVQRAFHPYFDPGSWDLDSEAPLALVKPKREIMALIGPHAQAVSTGQYNRVEREVLPARFPHLGADGRWRRPLHVSFRVDHYLDADHDRMTTEILMRAAAGAQFCQMVDVLDASIQLLENAMFLRQILRFLSFRVDDLDKEIRTRREELSALIVHLYRVSDDERQSANVVRTAGISHVLEKNRAAAADGVQVQRDNAAPVLAHLRAALSPVLDGLASALVVLYGGLAREEFGPASDLDIGVFCQDPALAARIREAIATLAGTELGLSVEFLPISNIEAIGKLAADAPDSIVDFLCGKVLGGPPDLAGRYQAAVSALCGDDACKLAARRYLDRHESLGKWHSAKQSLALLYLRAFVAGTLCDSASLADIASERAPLLWRKNEEAFSDNGKPAWSGGSQT